MYRLPILWILTLSLPLLAQNAEKTEFFEKNIRPVLAAKCQRCHNSRMKSSGLDLSSGEGFVHGGGSGALVDTEKPETSLLLQVVSYDGKLKMPPSGKLQEQEIAALRDWVKMGAPWPGMDGKTASLVRTQGKNFTPEEKKFWAFQPITNPPVPTGKNQAWVKTPIDAFILAKLEEKALQPGPPAGKLVLLRRVTLDLTGLPPTEKQERDFLANNSPNAYRDVVDRLLASPRYGEKWGRHWLDVARYADSTGNDEDHKYPYAWRYRDYVIDEFQNDRPINQFLREQLAGDLIPSPDGYPINKRGRIATGFIALGAKAIAQQDKKKMLYDVYDEQIDTVSKGMLGLTIACSRCHDHKFDPILTRDYYSLAGIFASTRDFKDAESHVSSLLFTPLVPEEEYKQYQAKLAEVERKGFEADDLADGERKRHSEALAPKLAAYMLAAREVKGGANPAAVAGREKLDEAILAKWMRYLEPRDSLAEWQKATGVTAAAVAADYQTRAAAALKEWNQTVDKWRAQFQKMTREMNMPPPPRPKISAQKHEFFREVFADDGPFGVPAKDEAKTFAPDVVAKIAAIRAGQKAMKDSLPPEPDMACSVQEGTPVAQKVFLRGDYNSLGEDAPKTFPLILAGEDRPIVKEGSGRLELANWIASDTNPLTARVFVNRMWLWHFGEGIVRTPDNFGKMGDRPTHPELLDYLASQFIANGWKMKDLHRMMLLSNTYRLSSAITAQQNEADPENRLLSHFNRRRMEVEEMRDSLLAISGRLDLTMGGTLQTGFGTDSENGAGRLSLNPEEQTRRTVYLPLRRANLPALLNLFDFGDATTTAGKRNITNVAPQALFMMNSKFVLDQAAAVVDDLFQDPAATDAERMQRAFLKVLNRQPTSEEADSLLTYKANFHTKFPSKSERDSWLSAIHVLMASNEFIYVD